MDSTISHDGIPAVSQILGTCYQVSVSSMYY